MGWDSMERQKKNSPKTGTSKSPLPFRRVGLGSVGTTPLVTTRLKSAVSPAEKSSGRPLAA